MKHKTYQDLTESIRLIMEKPQYTDGGRGAAVAAAQEAAGAATSAAQTTNTQPAQELSQAQALAKSRGVTDYDSLPQWRKDAFEANAARKGMEAARAEVNNSTRVKTAQDNLNKAREAESPREPATITGRDGIPITVPGNASADVQKAEKDLRTARAQGLAANTSYTDNLKTFKQYHTETNPIQPVERNGGGFSMGRGFGGMPIITGGSYVNPNSAEARVRADVRSGKLPASFGQYQGNRLPMDWEAEQKAAGDKAFDASIQNDFGIPNASKLSRSDLFSTAKQINAQRNQSEREDSNPNVRPGEEIEAYDTKYTNISRSIPKLDREYKDARDLNDFNDSLKGEAQKNQAQMDLRAKQQREKWDSDDREDMYAGMKQHQTLPHGEIPPAPPNKNVGSMIPNQNAASHVAALFAPGVSTPKSSFKDAVKSVAQSSTPPNEIAAEPIYSKKDTDRETNTKIVDPNRPLTFPNEDEDNSREGVHRRSEEAKDFILRRRAEREAAEQMQRKAQDQQSGRDAPPRNPRSSNMMRDVNPFSVERP